MKKKVIPMVTLALLLLPLAAYAQTNHPSTEAPPISQSLVPEGDFAIKLAPALGLGTLESEAQAEDLLTSVGIAPKNGWIADYPVTPDIIGELQDGVAFAADSKRLPMGKEDALKSFQNLTVELGLAVVPGGPGQYAENQPQPDSAMIDNYYDEEGPPVVTYYPPPWDYYYLYAWVPFPFWWGGFFFSGFFCLNDFQRFHHNHLISNHFVDPVNGTVARVDPVGRRTGNSSGTADVPRNRGFNSTEARRGATSIFERSRGQGFSRGENQTSTLRGRGETGTVSRSITGRTMTQPDSSERNAQGASTAETRSFSGSGRSNERSFSPPSAARGSFGYSGNSGRTFGGSNRSFGGSSSGGGSFSCANCHGGSGSFGRSSGGSGFGGFSGGHSSEGFSGGHSSGGFSGGHSFGGSSGGGFSGSGFSGGGGGGGHGGGGRGR
jgi:hypothetical protein